MEGRSDEQEQKGIGKVKAYYRVTRLFYKYFWHGETDAIHYGYFDDSATTLKEALLRTIEKTAEAAEVTSGKHIIDLGCGVGGADFWLASRVSGHITGITLSKEQYKKALKTKTQRRLGDNVTFVCGNYCDTPFDNESFDRAISIEATCYAHHCIDLYAAELYRILKPDSKIAIADAYRASRKLSEQELSALRVFEEGVVLEYLITPEQFMEGLKRQGFKNVQFQDWSLYMLPSAEAMYKKIMKWDPLVRVLTTLRLLPDVLVKNHAAGKAQLHLARNAVVVYGCVTAEK